MTDGRDDGTSAVMADEAQEDEAAVGIYEEHARAPFNRPRHGLVRLREKVRRESEGHAGPTARRSREDLVQLRYARAERRLKDQFRADLASRERLTEAHLGVEWQTIGVSSAKIQEPHVKPVLRLVGRQLAEHPTVELAGADLGQPPSWGRFELGDEVEPVPTRVSVFWDAGMVTDGPLVLQTWEESTHQTLQVFSRPEHHDDAKAYLNRIINDARGSESPYRGRLLKASWGRQGGIAFEVLSEPEETRDRLVLPTPIWEALDANVHRMFERMPTFLSAGLGSNRGVLLAGAPGTGKTAACRVLARELLGSVTAVFVESRAAQALLPQLYGEISGLAPALVLLEDLDLLVGDREARSERWALVDFLTVLDGLMTQHREVVTVATTNDPDAIDAGVGRAGRFDGIIEFPLPDEQARRQILEVYLQSLDHRVDIGRVARDTDGKTGADLREYVRSALLAADDTLDTEDFVRFLADLPPGNDVTRDSKGKYL